MERQAASADRKPYEGLRGRELVAWALSEGESCLDQLPPNSPQVQYFNAIARRAGVEFPPGFFDSTVEELMDRH